MSSWTLFWCLQIPFPQSHNRVTMTLNQLLWASNSPFLLQLRSALPTLYICPGEELGSESSGKPWTRSPQPFPMICMAFTKCSTLKLFVALSTLLKRNGFYLNSWFLFKYLVSSAQAQVPFPFPPVPGSHADTSIINNASDPSNMPLAGSCSIPHVSGPALGCSCFRGIWLLWRGW